MQAAIDKNTSYVSTQSGFQTSIVTSMLSRLEKIREEIDDLIEELEIMNDREVLESIEQAEAGETIKFESLEHFKKHYGIYNKLKGGK